MDVTSVIMTICYAALLLVAFAGEDTSPPKEKKEKKRDHDWKLVMRYCADQSNLYQCARCGKEHSLVPWSNFDDKANLKQVKKQMKQTDCKNS